MHIYACINIHILHFICSIHSVQRSLQGLGRSSSRVCSFSLTTIARLLVSSCLIHRLLVSADSVGSHTIQFTFMTLNSFTEAFLITLFLSSPFFLELVALNYQSLGLSPVTGWWGVEDSITCAEVEHLNASPASPDIHRVGNRSGIEEMCSNGALHPEVVVERSHGRECHVFITLSLRGFLS